MKERVKSAVILLAISLACVLIHPVSRLLFFAAAGLCCAYEYSRAVEKVGVYCCAWVMYSYIVIQAFLALFHVGLIALIACFCLSVYLALFSGILHRKVSGTGTLYTLAGVAYPCFLFSLMMEIAVSDYWLQTLLIACSAAWICDTFAMFGGVRFGKHKVAPHVSPNKSVEGCICGALSSIPTGILLYFILPLVGVPESLATCLITSIIASTLGQMGDLAESLLKRMIGIKDFSDLIPGHGGMFDRVDSLMFAVPATFLCILIAHT